MQRIVARPKSPWCHQQRGPKLALLKCGAVLLGRQLYRSRGHGQRALAAVPEFAEMR